VGCRGVHFSLDADQVAGLRAIAADERVEYIQETFEEKLWSADASRAEETDKAWDAIHRSLTDGSLDWDNGSFPLNHVILGGEAICEGEYIVRLKAPEQVEVIAVTLPTVTKELLRQGYDAIDPSDYGMPLSEDDFEYTWNWFQGLIEFYRRAAAAGFSVIFTVDQ